MSRFMNILMTVGLGTAVSSVDFARANSCLTVVGDSSNTPDIIPSNLNQMMNQHYGIGSEYTQPHVFPIEAAKAAVARLVNRGEVEKNRAYFLFLKFSFSGLFQSQIYRRALVRAIVKFKPEPVLDTNSVLQFLDNFELLAMNRNELQRFSGLLASELKSILEQTLQNVGRNASDRAVKVGLGEILSDPVSFEQFKSNWQALVKGEQGLDLSSAAIVPLLFEINLIKKELVLDKLDLTPTTTLATLELKPELSKPRRLLGLIINAANKFAMAGPWRQSVDSFDHLLMERILWPVAKLLYILDDKRVHMPYFYDGKDPAYTHVGLKYLAAHGRNVNDTHYVNGASSDSGDTIAKLFAIAKMITKPNHLYHGVDTRIVNIDQYVSSLLFLLDRFSYIERKHLDDLDAGIGHLVRLLLRIKYFYDVNSFSLRDGDHPKKISASEAKAINNLVFNNWMRILTDFRSKVEDKVRD